MSNVYRKTRLCSNYLEDIFIFWGWQEFMIPSIQDNKYSQSKKWNGFFFCSILKNNSQIAMEKSFLNNLKNKTISNEADPEYILASLLVCIIFNVVLILKNDILCYKILNQRHNLFQRYTMDFFFFFFSLFFVFWDRILLCTPSWPTTWDLPNC